MGLAAADSAPAGRPNRHWRGKLAGRPIAQPGELTHHLVEGGIDVVGELDLRHRLESIDTHADGRGDNAAFRDGSVEHTMLAMFPLQAVGHAEDAAEVANILAQDHDPRVALEHD